MDWIRIVLARCAALFRNKKLDADLDEELRAHIALAMEENRRSGMNEQQARTEALRSFGGVTQIRESYRMQRGLPGLAALRQDVHFATRQIRRAPGFALIAILTLALGIGANTAIFTLTHALLLSGLPVPDPGRLVRLAIDFRGGEHENRNAPLSLPMIEMLRNRASAFSGVFGWSVYDFVLKDDGVSHGRRGAMVSGNAFEVLGLHPVAGRLLNPADDQPGGGPDGWAAVISYRLWIEQFQRDPAVVGRHLTVTDHGVTIVGVAPEGFEGVIVAEHPDLYLPAEFSAALNDNEKQLHEGGMMWLTAFARLKPGVGRAQAEAELTTLFPSMLDAALPLGIRHLPEVEHSTLDVSPARTGWSPLRVQYTKPLLLLHVLVGLVLLICCANLSGLFLARASARQPEFAIRAALGAKRGRLMLQLLVESMMLAVPGALLSVGLAWLVGPWLLHGLGNSEAQVSLSTRPDFAVLAITAACACLCALLFGMAPAWAASRTNFETALRSTRSRTGAGNASARRVFIPFQVALSLALVVVAALLGATVVHMRTEDSGFRMQNVVFYYADFGRLQQKGVDLLPLYRRITMRMEEKPGVDAASVTNILPYYGWIEKESFTAAADALHSRTMDADVSDIGADYFAAMGTRILAGRDLRNDNGDLHSCIVNERAATMYFPHGSALGQMMHEVEHNLRTDTTTVWDCQVVGIVQNTKYDTVREAPPAIVYRPVSERSVVGLFFAIHARSLAEARQAYQSTIGELAPESPETDPATFTQLFNDSAARDQLLSAMSGFFAVLALMLSGIGIYGLVAWNVTQRTTEIGVRMALGATRAGVFLMVLRQTMVLMAVGVVAGGALAYFAAQSVHSFLYEIQAEDPRVFALAAGLLIIIGLLAATVPARRAVSINPMQALRNE
jgi:putative ABC transport system permease protein